MKSFKKFCLLPPLLLTLHFFTTSTAKPTQPSFCGNIRIQTAFSLQNSMESSMLNRMTVCKSQKLYFRTTLGLFPISSIDYTSKILTISHPASCSSSLQFVSPSLLSAGFPTPTPNSLLLFNCSDQRHPISLFIRNCTKRFHGCRVSSQVHEKELGLASSCLLIDDLEKLNMGFEPKELNCSHYSRVYRDSSGDDDGDGGFELGTRISFEVPGHVPDICKECEKSNGDCGVGLRCICHPKECKDKVLSMGGSKSPLGTILFSLISFTMMLSFIVS